MYTLREIYDLHISKEYFLDYYTRCIFFNIQPCLDAVFKVGNYNDISVDIRGVKEERVDIPGFVNSICCATDDKKIVNDIKYINLNRVSTISSYGLESFYNLEEIKGDYLTGIGSGGMKYCTNLREVNLPKLRSIGECGLFGCERLERIIAPDLLYTKDAWLSYRPNLKYIYAPKLQVFNTVVFTYFFTNFAAIKLVCNDNTKIMEQECLGFELEDSSVISWSGELLGKVGMEYKRQTYNFNKSEYKVIGNKYYVLGLKVRGE